MTWQRHLVAEYRTLYARVQADAIYKIASYDVLCETETRPELFIWILVFIVT